MSVQKRSYRRGFEGGPVREMMQIVPDPGRSARAEQVKQPGATATDIGNRAYGTSDIPFSTSSVELSPSRADVTKLYSFRAAGRLSFRTAGGLATCTAALVDKSVILTAAYCVVEYGGAKYSNFTFIPGYYKGQGAYGAFSARRVDVNARYANGTDFCASGASCDNDVAIIVLYPNADLKYAGNLAGWFGVGYDGYGFTSAGEAQITQFRYSGSLGGGGR